MQVIHLKRINTYINVEEKEKEKKKSGKNVRGAADVDRVRVKHVLHEKRKKERTSINFK